MAQGVSPARDILHSSNSFLRRSSVVPAKSPNWGWNGTCSVDTGRGEGAGWRPH